MIYDRCPQCRGPMWFHAITSTKGIWRRVMECDKCKVYVAADAFGANVAVTREMPPKKALARNEVLADAGSAADRFGQDDIRSLPGVQPDWLRS